MNFRFIILPTLFCSVSFFVNNKNNNSSTVDFDSQIIETVDNNEPIISISESNSDYKGKLIEINPESSVLVYNSNFDDSIYDIIIKLKKCIKSYTDNFEFDFLNNLNPILFSENFYNFLPNIFSNLNSYEKRIFLSMLIQSPIRKKERSFRDILNESCDDFDVELSSFAQELSKVYL